VNITNQMNESEQEKIFRLKANKLRVNRIYRQYKLTLERDPNILSQLWFADSYSHLMRLYDSYKPAQWCVLDFSSEIFLDDAEYRLAKWENYQVVNN
jgi:glutathione peroxidase-family protein